MIVSQKVSQDSVGDAVCVTQVTSHDSTAVLKPIGVRVSKSLRQAPKLTRLGIRTELGSHCWMEQG